MSKRNILLICNPTEASMGPAPKRVFPIGLGYVAGELLADGRFDVTCIDFQLAGVTNQTVLTELRRKPYEAVGIKGYAVDYKWFKKLIADIRGEFGADPKIVSGGPLATFSYEIVLTRDEVDVCALGEAETTFLKILDSFDDLASVPGIAYLDKNGEVRKTDGGWIPDKPIDEIAPPAYEIFDIEPYTENRNPIPKGWEKFKDQKFKVFDIITGRGCPFTCAFCGRMTKTYRKRAVNLVVEEMKFLMDRYDINCFAIEDELFVYQQDWVSEFCEKIKPLNVTWRCQSRARGLNLDVLKQMKAAGCIRITLGVESGSREILKNMVKKITPETIAEAIEQCREACIYPGTELIVGTPGETEDTVRETVELWRQLNLPPKQMAYLQCYPGTPYFIEYVDGVEIGSHEKVLHDLSYGDGKLTTLPHNISGLPDAELIRVKEAAEEAMRQNYQAELDTISQIRDEPIRRAG